MSILRSVISDYIFEEEKLTFLEKVHNESGIPLEDLEIVYSRSLKENKNKSNPIPWVKAQVYSFIEESSNVKQRNLVQKHSLRFNRGKVEPDKKKDSKGGKRKHKKDIYEQLETILVELDHELKPSQLRSRERIKKMALHLANQAMKRGQSSKDLFKRAKLADRMEEPNTDALFMAGELLARHEKRTSTHEDTSSRSGRLNSDHLRWAQKHDWGKDAYLDNGVIHGLIDTNIDTRNNNSASTEVKSFDNFRDLKRWAGY